MRGGLITSKAGGVAQILGLVLTLAVSAPTAAQEVPFRCPAKGTQMIFGNGRALVFEGPNDRPFSCPFLNTANNQTQDTYAIFSFENMRGGKNLVEKLAELWPLTEGKTVRFSVPTQSIGSNQFVTREYVVGKRQKIAIKAGEFDVVPVTLTTKGQGNNYYSAVTTYWYAPSVGYHIKFEFKIEAGQGENTQWAAAAIKMP